jgi:aminoglycoside phosphotransferase (APT) family kinase protein
MNMPAALPPDFDPTRLDAFLRDALPDLEGAMDLECIAGGQSNPTFFVSYENCKLVLRKQPSGDLLPSAHAIDREFRIMSALARTSAPAPSPIMYCNDPDVIGKPFYLMKRLEGRVFHSSALPGLQPAERRAMYASIAKALATIHQVDFEGLGLADFGRRGNYFTRQIDRWTRQWSLCRTRHDPNVELLVAWLKENIPRDDRITIVHGDYRIGNLMFHATEPRVIAVLDWELSTLGHPLADLAHCAVAWKTTPSEYGGIGGLDLGALGIPSVEQFEHEYASEAPGRSRLSSFHMAFALFRWAVIFEGIAARANAGTAASEDALEMGQLAATFARRAKKFI